MTERAIALTPAEARAASPALLRRYDRVYVGSSFCQNLLPEAEDLRRLRAAGARAVTLATPLLTGEGLKRAAALVGAALRDERRLEVSVNDLGLLELLRRRWPGRAIPLLGRPVSRDFARMAPAFLRGFFRHYGIKLLETDEENIGRILPAAGFRLAFHYPYCCLAFTRLCPQPGSAREACRRPCGAETALLGPAGEALTLRGNAYFTGNKPPRLAAVRRLVYTPPAGRPPQILP